MDLTTVHEGGQAGWFALTCGLSSELSSLLSDGKHDVEIMWTSERKGVILVDGKAAFDVVLSESKVVEPYRLDQQNKELSYFGPVLGRCSTMSLGQSTAGGPNLNATAAAAAAATATAAAACGPEKKKTNRMNKLDEETVKMLSSSSAAALPSSRKRAASKMAELVMQGKKKTELARNERKKARTGKRNAAPASRQTSSVVLRNLPMVISAGQVDKFFSGLGVVEIFSVPNQNVLENASSFEGTTDLYVLFGSDVSAGLAAKRSGETMHLPLEAAVRSIKPTVEIVDEIEWSMSKGMGVPLPLSVKSTTTLSRLESLFALARSTFRCSDDQSAFLRVLLQRKTMPDIGAKVKESLEGVSWNPDCLFDPLLVDFLATPEIAGKATRFQMKLANRKAVPSWLQGAKFKQADKLPSRWNPVHISDALLLSGGVSHVVDTAAVPRAESLVDSLRDLLWLLQHLKGICLIYAGSAAEAAVEVGPPASTVKSSLVSRNELVETLSRMHRWYSGVLCAVWRTEHL